MLIIILLFLNNNKKILKFTNTTQSIKKNNKIELWVYYDDLTKIPSYLLLCLNSIYKQCKKSFNIKLIDDNFLRKNNIRNDILSSNYISKIQYIKNFILYHYGGLWIDIDTIVFKDLFSFTKNLKTFDFIGFDCFSNNCYSKEDYYNKPTDSILLCNKNSELMKRCLEIFDSLLDDDINNLNKFYIFRNILWDQLSNLNIQYYHVEPKYIGSRDIDNDIVSIDRLLQNKIIHFNVFNNIYLIKINYHQLQLSYDISTNEILNSKTLIANYYRKSIFNHPYPEIDTFYNSNIGVYVLYVPKRKKYISKLLSKIFLEVNYVKGPNKNKLNKMNLIKEGILNIRWNGKDKFNLGRCACHLGHINILQKFLESSQKYAIIFEDDIYINDNDLEEIRNKIKNIVKNIPLDTDIIYFSYCWERCNLQIKYNDIFDKPNRPFCRHMYLVSKTGANIILNDTLPMDRPGDNMVANLILQNKLVAYSVNQKYFNIFQDRETFKSNSDNPTNYRLCTRGHKYNN